MGRIKGYTSIKKSTFKLDCSKIYILPMIRTNCTYPNEVEDLIECTVSHSKEGYKFKSITEGYKDKLFIDSYVEFLLYTKYISQK